MLNELVPQIFLEEDGGAAGGSDNTSDGPVMPEWLAQGTAEQQADKALWEHKKLPDAITAFQKMKKAIPVVPKSPDEYNLEGDLPEGLVRNEAVDDSFRRAAHGAKLTKEQAAAFKAWHNNTMAGMIKTAKEKQAEMIEAAKNDLNDKLGKAGMANAEKAMRQYGGEELAKMAMKDPSKYGAFITAFADVGKRISEDSFAGVGAGGGDTGDIDLDEYFPDMPKG